MYDKIDQKMKKPANCSKIVKILTFASAILISVFGFIGLISMIVNNVISSTFFLIFSPIFIIIFGVVILAAEFKVKLVVQSFNFLQTPLGKGLFYIYVSSSVFYFFTCGGYQNDVLAWVCSMTLFGLGLLFCGLHFATDSYSVQLNNELSPQAQI